jgi:predicted DNA-binding transcriptional regulator AlpA
MGLSRSLLSTIFLCEHCHKETRFLPMQFAVSLTGRCRSTIYYWMERGWIHWRELPSGRRLICEESLMHPVLKGPLNTPNAKKPSKTV